MADSWLAFWGKTALLVATIILVPKVIRLAKPPKRKTEEDLATITLSANVEKTVDLKVSLDDIIGENDDDTGTLVSRRRLPTGLSLMSKTSTMTRAVTPGSALDISARSLIVLDATMIPSHVSHMSATRNQITLVSLPINHQLYSLDLSFNRLSTLLEQPWNSIRILKLAHNKLSSLPSSLPPSLEILDVRYNRISELPSSIASYPLSILRVSRNLLTSLPLNIGLCQSLTWFEGDENPWHPDFAPIIPGYHKPKHKRTSVPVMKMSFLDTEHHRGVRSASAMDSSKSGEGETSHVTEEAKEQTKIMVSCLKDWFELDASQWEQNESGVRIVPVSAVPASYDDLQPSPEIDKEGPMDAEKLEKLNKRRMRIIEELLSTEESYVNFLQNVFDIYVDPLKNASFVSREEYRSLFSNWESLLLMHRDALLPDLKSVSSLHQLSTEILGLLVGSPVNRVYVNNYETAMGTYESLLKRRKFRSFCDEAKKNPVHSQTNLIFYLIMPVQRVPRYKLLLQDLVKYTLSTHADYGSLHHALDDVQKRASEMNEKKRDHESMDTLILLQSKLTGSVTLIQPHRKLIYASLFQVERKRSQFSTSDELLRADIKSETAWFLFNDVAVQCKCGKMETVQENTSGDKKRDVVEKFDRFSVVRELNEVRDRSVEVEAVDEKTAIIRLVDRTGVFYLRGERSECDEWRRLLSSRSQ